MITTVLFCAFIGLFIGGLINVLADDLPQRNNPKFPHYPDGSPRPLTAWLGLSAFSTGQHSSSSGSKLSLRHPLTELGTALLFAITVLASHDEPNMSSIQLAFWLTHMAIFILITVIDLEHRLILFIVIIPAAVLAVLDAIITPIYQDPDLRLSLLGGVLGFSIFFLMYLGGYLFSYVVSRLRGYELPEVAFGYGDVMMATLSGLILGWQPLIFAMFITVFLGAFGALVYLALRAIIGHRYSMFTALPYGQYIVIGTIIMLLFSTEVRMLMTGS